MPSTTPRPRHQTKGKADPFGRARRRTCSLCREKIEEVDFKSLSTLRRVMSDKGKIRSRRLTGTCRRHQNQITVAIKRARELALLPTVTR